MKHLLTIGLAVTLGLAGAASAQTTSMQSSRVAPNGSVHTTTHTVGPNGVATTHTVEKANGDRVVRRTRTDDDGTRERTTVKHRWGSDRARVCHSEWRHHRRIKHCWTRHRD